MGRGFKNVWPYKVQEMNQRIVAALSLYTQCDVLNCSTGSLTMCCISIHKSIFKKCNNRVDIIFPQLSYVLKKKRNSLENPILDIDIRNAILIHQSRKYREGTTAFCDNRYSNCRAHPHLPILDFKIVQQCVQDILRTNCFGDVPKSVHCSPSHGFLFCAKELDKLKTNTHPFSRRDKFCTPICNPTHQIYAILLHFFVSIPQNRCQSWKEILNRWCHFPHANNVHNAT
mmetsp:Transcript_2772/g.5316  ORF Transcript_2772/g.5316 Transcript_2772/m.5316 type:complete len:229 (+) Transcript_2772:1650-2336(+)